MLNGWGIGRGDRVALIVGPRPEALVGILCVASATTVMPINPKATSDELKEALVHLEADAVIVSEELEAAAQTARVLGLTVLSLQPRAETVTGSFDLTGGITGTATLPGPPESADIAFILMTSGTTATPKAIPLAHDLVIRRGACEAAAFGLTPSDRCLNFRPAHLHGALNAGLIAPLIRGGGVVVPDDFDADAFFRDLKNFGVTWYTGGPAYHMALLERADAYREIIENSSLRLVRSASYSLSPDLMQRLESTFDVVCLERYGSTESGLISRNPPPPAHRKPGTAGVPFDNEVAIFDQDGRHLPAGNAGEIAVRGPNVFSGNGDEDNDASAPAGDGWYQTGDFGAFDDEGYLTVLGRISEVINRGGQKVSPHEVEAVLSAHDAVRECVCFAIPHPTLGQAVAAAVVLCEESAVDEKALQAHVGHSLSKFKVPIRVVECAVLPRGLGGKLQRLQAAAHFGLAELELSTLSPSMQLGVPKRSALVSALAALWGDILHRDNISDDDNFVLLGGDSLRAARLCANVAEVLGVSLPIEIVFGEGATIAGMANAITTERNRQAGQPTLY